MSLYQRGDETWDLAAGVYRHGDVERPFTDDEHVWAAGLLEAARREENAATLRSRARQAVAANQAYLAVVSPTQAEVVAQVKALTRQVNGLARLLVGQDLLGEVES